MKLLPGVRIRISSRGIRAGIGPRALRLHVGTGRPGISTGFGPFSAYTPLAPSTRGSWNQGGGAHSTSGHVTRLVSQATLDKQQRADQIRQVLSAISDIHRAEFAPNVRYSAPPPPPPDRSAIMEVHRRAALANLSLFDRAGRARARLAAEQGALAEIARLEGENLAQQAAYQEYLDNQWGLLIANEPNMVVATLAAAFEDNDATAVPVGVDGASASLAVLVPTESTIPEREPSITEAGNLSLRLMSKSRRNSWYLQMVCGYMLVTVKEAFAVAPGLTATSVAALRPSLPDAYGRRRAEVIAAATIERGRLAGIRWREASSIDVLNAVKSQLFISQDRTYGLRPLDQRDYPGIDGLLASIDLEDLLSS